MELVQATPRKVGKGGKRMNKWFQALTRRTKGEKGVTLIELLAVIVIIAVIAAIAVPVVLGSINKSKTNTAKQDMVVIAEALNRYATDHDGKFPDTLSVLLQGDNESGSKPYLQSIPQDPWGNDFVYHSTGDGFQLETAAAAGSGSGDKLYLDNHMSTPSDSGFSNTTS
ncbi:type II secretion system protein GspG [Alicyclobacillus macrosporangiidus]|uniref:General secretion pathway protein G n=1 Tax=Alicyclobacillus macrosporangiidus TaxID=392015 RepID=A0A1I7JVT8_9BACL|nr:type II secretion system protein GspG [Alicyclobacillus macrosporangiidus]SFU89311.1 general secretion pathway protein G [Alicyclobacillus macrosporangiidus]